MGKKVDLITKRFYYNSQNNGKMNLKISKINLNNWQINIMKNKFRKIKIKK